MFIIRIIRFLRGYICFAASEGFPERFLNLCNQAGAVVWEIAWKGETMLGKTDRHGFARMKNCAEPAGVTLEIRRKVGLPFFLHTYRRRAGMLVGLAVCVASLAALSGRVWTIEVRGNQKVSTAQILRIMREEGVRPGARRKRLVAADVNSRALEKLDGVSWISLNLRGSGAVIEVREELPAPTEMKDDPIDIAARKTGQLRVLEIYSGMPYAGVGDTVLEGGVIAGGAIENKDLTQRYVRADAYAVARTRIAARVSARRRETLERVDIAKTHYTLCILNLRIGLGVRKQESGVREAWATRFAYAPKIDGVRKEMPLALERVSYVVYTGQERVKSDRQLRLSAAERLFDEGCRSLRAAQFLRQAADIQLGADDCVITLEGSAYENIGMERALGNEQ